MHEIPNDVKIAILDFLAGVRFSFDHQSRTFVVDIRGVRQRFVPTANDEMEADQVLDMWEILGGKEVSVEVQTPN